MGLEVNPNASGTGDFSPGSDAEYACSVAQTRLHPMRRKALLRLNNFKDRSRVDSENDWRFIHVPNIIFDRACGIVPWTLGALR